MAHRVRGCGPGRLALRDRFAKAGELVRELRAEQLLDNRYRLVRIIGAGTFGTVWCAEHLALRSPVAIKVLDPAIVTGDEVRERFIREAWAAAALRSPHVVQILDCGVDGDATYIVMELLEGESLEQRIARQKKLDVLETERVVRHVARAIDRAHAAGIIHRDLKPGNIFIQSNDGDEMVKVLDFGIAKRSKSIDVSPAGVTPTGILMGTPHYMSPEQIHGVERLDGRTDLWSLGVIAFECLLGRPPFDGESISAVLTAILSGPVPVPSQHGSVPPGFDTWFARACARRRSDRYDSGKLAADEFARLCEVPESPFVSTSRARGAALGDAASRAVSRASGTLRLTRHSASEHPWPRRTLSLLLALASLAFVWQLAVGRSHGVEQAALADVQTVEKKLQPSGAARPEVPLEPALPAARAPAAGPESTPARGSSSARSEASAGADDRLGAEATRSDGAEGAASEAPAVGAPQPAPAPSVKRVNRPKKRASRSSAQTREPDRAPANCDPPWQFDRHGQPRAKAECL